MELTEKIKELAGQPRFVDEEDVLVEPIPALEELYASIPYSVDGPEETQTIYLTEEYIARHRNDFLTTLAGAMRRKGLGEDYIRKVLGAVNEVAYEVPLPEYEVGRIARGMERYEPEAPYYAAPSTMPPFPSGALPPTLRKFVEEGASSLGCPTEFIAVPMLSTLGAAIGNSRVLMVKTDWFEGTAIYSVIVGYPGDGKSPALDKVTAPAWRRQEEYERKYREEMANYLCEKREWEAQRRQASNEGIPVPEPPEEPIMQRMVVEDFTVEALVPILKDNPQGVLCARDEISGWMGGMNQYKGGKGSDRQFYLSIWSNRSITVDRKGLKEPLMVSRPLIGLTGGIQPDILAEVKNNRDDGLFDRFLPAWPESVPSYWSDDELSDETKAAYQRVYDRLCGLPMETNENGNLIPQRVKFTPEARAVFIKEHDLLEKEMNGSGFPKYLRGPWSKMKSYLARLSLILALVRMVEDEHYSGDSRQTMMEETYRVTENDVRAAAAMIEYFKAHTRKVYAKLHDERPQNLLGVALKDFLHEQGGRWEGMTEELYNLFKVRSVPGLPGGPVPFGKMIRQIARQDDDLMFGRGHKGKNPIIKLSLSTSDTPVHGGSGDTDTESTEGTESKFEDIDTDVEDLEEPVPHPARSSGPVAQINLRETEDTDPDDETTEMERAQILEIERVLREKRVKHPEYLTSYAKVLIEEGVFYDLDFAPARRLVEEAQLRILEENDQKMP